MEYATLPECDGIAVRIDLQAFAVVPSRARLPGAGGAKMLDSRREIALLIEAALF